MDWPFISPRSRRRDRIEAIDLGGRTTKGVLIQRRGERLSLANFASLDAPPEAEKFSPAVLSEHLKNMHRALGNGRSAHVSLALGVNETVFRPVELPVMPVADLRQMLKFHAKTYLQQDFPGYVFDCTYCLSNLPSKAGETGKPAALPQKHKVLVAGAKKELIDQLQAAIKTAGLTAHQIVPGVLGPVNAFELAAPEVFEREIVALVDLGFQNTTITILEAGDLMLNRVVGIGGNRLTQGLADAMGITYIEAEGIKVGIPNEVQAQLEALLIPLGRELRASIDFFEHQRDKTVSQIFLSGAAARNDFIIQALQGEMIVPCKGWNPAASLTLELAPQKVHELETLAPQLAVALGTAAASF
jgi:type IV pilus assembly protein PilM